MSDAVQYEPPPKGFRTFLILWGTQSVSVIGSALTLFAINIWLAVTVFAKPEQKADLAWALAAVDIAFGVTIMLVTPLAGAWADRHDRKLTMVIVDVVLGLLSLMLVALVLAEVLQFWILLVLMVIFAAFSAFHASSFEPSYVMLVPEKQLARANGMMQTMWALSNVISPGLAALLISLPALAREGIIGGELGDWLVGFKDGTALAIGIDMLTFFIAAAVLAFLFIPSPERAGLPAKGGKPQTSIWTDVKEGMTYLRHRRPLLWLLGTFAVANFFLAVSVLLPLLVKFNLAEDWTSHGFTFETALAFLNSALGLGGLAGGILVSAWGGLKKGKVYGAMVGLVVAAAAQVLLGLSPFLWLASAALFVLAFTIPIGNAHSLAIWQAQVPRELQGRVMGVRRVIAQFSWPISTALMGWAGGMFNPGTVIFVMGVLFFVFCVIQLFNPNIRRVEDREWIEKLAAERANLSSNPTSVTLDSPENTTAA